MYDYKLEKPRLFQEENQALFLAIRDRTGKRLRDGGAAMMGYLIEGPGISGGDCWLRMACVDRLIELGEIREVNHKGASQQRIFVLP